MPTNLTLKNVPDEVYERLKASAEQHRRSLNREAIFCLETVLMARQTDPSERLARARALRERLSGRVFKIGDITRQRRKGRP